MKEEYEVKGLSKVCKGQKQICAGYDPVVRVLEKQQIEQENDSSEEEETVEG